MSKINVEKIICAAPGFEALQAARANQEKLGVDVRALAAEEQRLVNSAQAFVEQLGRVPGPAEIEAAKLVSGGVGLTEYAAVLSELEQVRGDLRSVRLALDEQARVVEALRGKVEGQVTPLLRVEHQKVVQTIAAAFRGLLATIGSENAIAEALDANGLRCNLSLTPPGIWRGRAQSWAQFMQQNGYPGIEI